MNGIGEWPREQAGGKEAGGIAAKRARARLTPAREAMRTGSRAKSNGFPPFSR
jgi:hypothetical protein